MFICILGSVPSGVRSKRKEGHPFLEYIKVPLKIRYPVFTISLSVIYIYIQLYYNIGPNPPLFPLSHYPFISCLSFPLKLIYITPKINPCSQNHTTTIYIYNPIKTKFSIQQKTHNYYL